MWICHQVQVCLLVRFGGQRRHAKETSEIEHNCRPTQIVVSGQHAGSATRLHSILDGVITLWVALYCKCIHSLRPMSACMCRCLCVCKCVHAHVHNILLPCTNRLTCSVNHTDEQRKKCFQLIDFVVKNGHKYWITALSQNDWSIGDAPKAQINVSHSNEK